VTAGRETTDDLGARLAVAAASCRSRLAGVPRWEVFAKTSLTRQTELVDGRLRRSLEIDENGVAVRLFDGARAGFAAVSGLEPAAAHGAVEAAAAGAAPGPDPMPPARLLGATPVAPGPAMAPAGWAQHVAGELGIALATMSEGVLRLGRVIAQEGRYRWLLATAEGWSAEHERMAASLLLEVMVGDRPGVWREWVHVADPQALDLAALAARIGDRVLLTRHRIATDGGLHDLILHPEMTAQLLAAIAPLFVATPDARDPLPRLLGSDGLLAAYALTVVDDRADPTAPVVSPCDGEGLPSRRTLLLDEGAPRHRVASFADARRLDETPRGGAVRRSYRDRPATGLANLRVVTDDGRPPGELLGASDRALYLLRPLAPVSCDLVSGAYSLIASGVWIEGRRVLGWHPVVELTGKIGSLLRRIEAVGTDLAWFQTSQCFVGAPSLLVRRQSVIG
jgi:PmbA protein